MPSASSFAWSNARSRCSSFGRTITANGALFAYHIGNSHQPVMIADDAIVCPDALGMEQVLTYHAIPFLREQPPIHAGRPESRIISISSRDDRQPRRPAAPLRQPVSDRIVCALRRPRGGDVARRDRHGQRPSRVDRRDADRIAPPASKGPRWRARGTR